jgi:WD40 repeat protein
MGKELGVVSLPEGWTEGVLQNPSGGGRFTTMALFSPAGRLILTSSDSEGLLQIWRAPTETTRPYEMWQLVWRGSAATCGAFAPDRSFVVTGMRDRQVLIWPAPTRGEVTQQLQAAIVLAEPFADPKSRQVRIRAEVDNSNGSLIPGAPVTLVAYPR